MAQEKFYDILVKELEVRIRNEIRAELHLEVQNKFESPQNLNAKSRLTENQMQSVFFELPKFSIAKKNAYANFKKSASKKVNPEEIKMLSSAPKKRKMTCEEYLCYEIFLRLGAELSEDFCERELKREYHKLAMKFHPDIYHNHSGKNLAPFNEAKQCYDKLCKSLEVLDKSSQF